MTREIAVEWLLRQALLQLNGCKPNEGIFIKALHKDAWPYQVWHWKEETIKTHREAPWLPDGIEYSHLDVSHVIDHDVHTMNDAIETALRDLLKDEVRVNA